MVKKKIVFLGSKPVGFRCFAHLLSQKETLGLDVVGLLTQPRKEFGDSDLARLAAEHNVPILDGPDALPECDVLYSVQYHLILKQRHIDRARQIAVNLHMAPLPEYRGSNQFSFAIVDGKKEFGTTLHVIDARIDHGDVLFQKRFPIPDGCWVNDLYQRTYEASVALFEETLADVATGRYTRVPQERLVKRYGTSLHYRNEIAALKKIDLSWDREKIERHIRATFMPGFEPPYTEVNGVRMYFMTKP